MLWVVSLQLPLGIQGLLLLHPLYVFTDPILSAVHIEHTAISAIKVVCASLSLSLSLSPVLPSFMCTIALRTSSVWQTDGHYTLWMEDEVNAQRGNSFMPNAALLSILNNWLRSAIWHLVKCTLQKKWKFLCRPVKWWNFVTKNEKSFWVRDYWNSTALANHYYSDPIKNSRIIYFAVSFTITRSCMCKMLLGWTAFYWSELAHECCCCSLHPKYTTMQGTDGGVVPLKQCRIQFLYKSHMSATCLTLNAYILITIWPWLKGCVWRNYFWASCLHFMLLSWYTTTKGVLVRQVISLNFEWIHWL